VKVLRFGYHCSETNEFGERTVFLGVCTEKHFAYGSGSDNGHRDTTSIET